jgi:hypothetical protein
VLLVDIGGCGWHSSTGLQNSNLKSKIIISFLAIFAMPRLNSVIRRYTPPSCTLEIWAQSSPLSRWLGRNVLKELRFELHFLESQLPGENQVSIRGDREQLEALSNAVTAYVQKLLQQSAESFWISFLEPQQSNAGLDEPESPDIPSIPTSPQPLPSFSTQAQDEGIYLECSGHLTHQLFLGSLAPSYGSCIQLSLLQLFDLATALDEYSADVMALPNLGNYSNLGERSLPSWSPVAAVFLIAAGLTPLTWQYAHNARTKQQQTAKQPAASQETVALKPAPTPPPLAPTPAGNLFASPNSSGAFATPSLNTTPLPTSILPSAPLPTPLSFPNATVPSTAKTAPPIQNPPVGADLQIPLPATAPNLPPNPPEVTTQTGINIASPQNSALRNGKVTGKVAPGSISSVPQSVDNNLPPQSAPTQIFSPADLQQLEEIRKNPPPSTITSTRSNNDNLIAKLREAKKASLPPEVATNSTNATLFDTPQVAEARDYLKKRWQPPKGFTGTLEYSLSIAVDGSVERILPLNQAAREYVDSSGLPEIGKPFVSTNKSGQNIRLRVVLSPDGKVQTFPESP